MPANLTPQYYAAEEAFKNAVTLEEKIAALEEMLAVIPKHKGTEKLQADLKRRLSKLRQEGEQKAKTARHDPFAVPKEGAGQVVLLGFPNAGKSALVGALTRAKVTVADYPFATTVPVSGMMQYEDIAIQLVDLPPITRDVVPPGLVGALQNADVILVVVDAASPDLMEQLQGCIDLLRLRRVVLGEGEERLPGSHAKPWRRLVFVASKADLPEAGPNLEVLRELMPDIDILPVSVRTGENLNTLRKRLFEALEVIRVYSKIPGKDPDMEAPFILPAGSTVVDMAAAVHRDFPQKLKNARVWGSVRFDGQSVPREYVLQDKDIVELHIS